MTLRTTIANWGIDKFRKFGRKPGESEIAVELSDHSINVRMVETSKDDRAWDSDLFRYGNVFVEGYANPVKPVVDRNKELKDPDTVDVEEGNTEQSASAEEVNTEQSTSEEDRHVELISSDRYRAYMRQDLISQLLNPREQWRLIAYGIIAVAFVLVINLVVTMSAAGVF